MDAAARLRPFLFVDFVGGLHPRMAWIYLRWADGVSVDPRHAWMDHSVAVVQYRRVWRGFAPRG